MSKFWSFVKNEALPDQVELRIEGEIVSDDDAWFYEWFDIKVATPNSFRSALAEHKGKDLTVWIDSWGGDVFAAAGIYNALKNHKGKITAKVDGKAVSAATVIAMAADELLMSPVSIFMIHNPWTYSKGESKDMRQAADVLDQVKETIVNAYQLKTKRSREEISGLMDRTSWMSAQTAIAEGFVDGVLYSDAPDAKPVKNFSMVSGLAIQNSAEESMRKLFEMMKKQEQHVEEDTPVQNRVIDSIKKRVNVREKQNGRYARWTN